MFSKNKVLSYEKIKTNLGGLMARTRMIAGGGAVWCRMLAGAMVVTISQEDFSGLNNARIILKTISLC